MATYACSDLHGNWELWAAIKNFLKPDDTLYFLGDAADRGPDGWAIIKDMLQDARVVYLSGNHEEMLVDRINNPYTYEAASLHHQNGGNSTWIEAEKDPEAKDIACELKQLPLWVTYTNQSGQIIFMSHSGSTDIGDRDNLLWDRSEYISRKKYDDYDVIVHGHTTIPHLIKDLNEIYKFYYQENERPELDEWEGGAYWYHGRRCDIDCCTIKTRQTVLLDLDTFDEHIFQL